LNTVTNSGERVFVPVRRLRPLRSPLVDPMNAAQIRAALHRLAG
jgi:hypothetical protein